MRSVMVRLALFLGGCVLAFGANAQGPRLIVLVGGYDTCPGSKTNEDRPLEEMTLWEPFERLVLKTAHQEGREQPYVLACYGATRGKASERELYLRIRGSGGSESKIFLTRDGERFRARHFEPAILALEDAIDRARRVFAAESIVLVGHSYGGYTLAEVARRSGTAVPITLFTLDPIHPEQCSPYLYRNSGLRIPKGCRESPRSWKGEQGSEILASTQGRWWNLYQDQFVFNHSGPVEILQALDRNHRLQVEPHFKSGSFPWHYHAWIARDPQTWRWMTRAMQSTHLESPP